MIQELIGFIGVLLVLVAYFMLNVGFVKARSYGYLIPNVIGSIILMCNAIYIGSLTFTVINAAFLSIGMGALLDYIFRSTVIRVYNNDGRSKASKR